jgi:multidrug efflux pump subunit AcrB
VLHFTLDQNRLQATGLTSSAVAEQLQFLLSGVPVTSVREDIRSVEVVGRAAGDIRLDPAKIEGLPWSAMRDSAFRCLKSARLRSWKTDPAPPRSHPTITAGRYRRQSSATGCVGRHHEELQPIVDSLPAGYRIDMAGSIEESGKATQAMLPLFPIMIALTLLIIILQVRSLSAMVMVFLTAPLGLIGVVPTLLIFNQPFGINALVGLIALSGILMRNTLILIGQIDHNQKDGLDPFQAVVEATVSERARSC